MLNQTRIVRTPLFEYMFVLPWENPPNGKLISSSDFSTIFQMLNGFLRDVSALNIFRSILMAMADIGSIQINKFKDCQVIENLSRMIVLGRIKVYYRECKSFSFHQSKPIAVAPSQVKEQTSNWVEVSVVWNDDGQPIPHLQVVVVAPDGQRNVKQTGSDGRIRIDQVADGICEVRCSTNGVKLEECVNFIGEGQQRITEQGATAQQGSTTTKSDNPLAIALIEAHKVATGETLASLASKAGITWQDLAYFNWGTKVPEEINKHLASDVGCTKKTADGTNPDYALDTTEAKK